jgi:integrase
MPNRKTGTLFKKTPAAAKWSGAFVHPFTGRRVVETLFTDRRASEVRLQELITQAEQDMAGIGDRFREHRHRPLREHVEEYLSHCRHVGESRVHVANKESQLDRLIDGTGAARITDLEPNRVERHLQNLAKSGRVKVGDPSTDKGLSARSVNQHRAAAIAFLEWCVQNNRTPDNPLKIVTKLDENRDRRRVRRAFTADELSRLLEAAPKRRSVYLIAVLTGLRRKELGGIRWSDVDLDARTIRVRIGVGKARREDWVALHPQALAELREIKPQHARGTDRVFASIPRDKTVRADLAAAGIDALDEAGRTVDFHALRTTTGTMLARAGASPQVAMRAMRHSDVKITMKHYTDLRLHDVASAVGTLPEIGSAKPPEREVQKATGTAGKPLSPEAVASAQVVAQLVAPVVALSVPEGASAFGMVHNPESGGSALRLVGSTGDPAQTRYTSALRTAVHRGAKGKGKANAKPLGSGLLGAISAVG